MFAIVITEKGGSQHRELFDQNEVTIGRVQGNDVILGKGNVSKRHSRLVRKDGRFIVVDLKSTNGTYVNGRRITAPLVVKPGDKIYIGDFILTIEHDDVAGDVPASGHEPLAPAVPPPPPPLSPDDVRVPLPPSARKPLPPLEGGGEPPTAPPAAAAAPTLEPPRRRELHEEPSRPFSSGPPAGPTRAGGSAAGRAAAFGLEPGTESAFAVLMARVATEFDVHDVTAKAMDDDLRWSLAERVIESTHRALVAAGSIDANVDPASMLAAALREAVGLGPLDVLLADASVREIVVHGPHEIAVDRGDGLENTGSRFSESARLETVIDRLFARAGERLDRSEAIHEAVLPNGAHVTVILPPVAVRGAIVEIRRLGKGPSLDELVAQGFLTGPDRAAIAQAVAARKNVFFVGPCGSGVTSLLGACAALVPTTERLVTVEAVPDLALDRPGVIALAAGRGRSGTTFAEILDKAQRLRGDRLVIDDVGATDLARVLGVLSARQGGNLVGVRTMPKPGEDPIHGLAIAAKLGGGDRSDAVDAWIARVVDVVVELETSATGRKVRRVVTSS